MLDSRMSEANGKKPLSMLAVVSIICLLMPFTFNVGPIVLSPSRVLFIFTVPILMLQLLSGRLGRIVFVDYMMILSVIWLALAIGYNNPESTITFVGSNAILLLGGYLTARATIRTPSDLSALGGFLTLMVLLTMPFAIAETLTSTAYIPRFFDAIPGLKGYADANAEARMGLERAQVIFAHPIHYGMFCSLAFSFVFVGKSIEMSLVNRIFWCSAILFCAFLSLSTGAFFAIQMQLFLIGWVYFFGKFVKNRKMLWKYTIVLFIAFYIALDFASNRPAYLAILQTISFNPSTVYLRTQIFEFGFEQVKQTPWLGVGFNGWARPVWMKDSIDNYYLFLAVIYGAPAAIFFMAAGFASVIFTSRANFEWGSRSFLLRRAWCFTLVSMLFTVSTVAVWGDMISIVYFFLGAGVWMHTYKAEDEKTLEKALPATERRLGWTRNKRLNNT